MRTRATIGLLFVAAVSLLTSGAEAQGESQILALTNASVIDGISEQPIRGATVVVRNGKIVSVSASSPDIPSGATVIDLKGMWLLPGLIDAHVHFADLAAARIALSSGVTTVRTGSSSRFLDVGIRDVNHQGIANLPDVVAVGYQVVRRPSELFFVDFPKMIDLMQASSSF